MADGLLSFVWPHGVFLGPLGEFIRVYANLPESPLNFDSPMPDHDSPGAIAFVRASTLVF